MRLHTTPPFCYGTALHVAPATSRAARGLSRPCSAARPTAVQPRPRRQGPAMAAAAATHTQAELERLLQLNFGLPSFRPSQLEAIAATLAGVDSLVVLPTGAARSGACTGGARRLPGYAMPQATPTGNGTVGAEARCSPTRHRQELCLLAAGPPEPSSTWPRRWQVAHLSVPALRQGSCLHRGHQPAHCAGQGPGALLLCYGLPGSSRCCTSAGHGSSSWPLCGVVGLGRRPSRTDMRALQCSSLHGLRPRTQAHRHASRRRLICPFVVCLLYTGRKVRGAGH